MTIGVELPDGNFKAPVSGEFLVKYAPAGKRNSKIRLISTTLNAKSKLLNAFSRTNC